MMSDREFKYLIVVEYETDPTGDRIGFQVLLDDDLDWLVERFVKADTSGFDSYLGSCPGLELKGAEECINGQRSDITETFKKMTKEYKNEHNKKAE